MALDDLLFEVATIVDQRGDRWALVGGLALAVHGIGRPTADVDVAIAAESQDAFIAALEAAGFDTVHRSSGYSNHVRGHDRVDVIYVRGETADRVFGDALFDGRGSLRIPVARPEHLAAMKVLAMKNDPDRAPGELRDLKELLGLPGVDREAIRAQMVRHGYEDWYEELEKRR